MSGGGQMFGIQSNSLNEKKSVNGVEYCCSVVYAISLVELSGVSPDDIAESGRATGVSLESVKSNYRCFPGSE